MKKRRIWPILLSIVVVGALAASSYVYFTADDTPQYTTVEVKRQVLEVSVAANGQLVDEFNYSLAAGVDPVVSSASAAEAGLGQSAISLPGYTIKKVLIAPGDRVDKKQPLLRLEDPLGEISTLRAPESGTVRVLRAIAGSKASGELVLLGSGRLLASVKVSEYDIAGLSIDQSARVNIDALSEEFAAKVVQIGQLADASTGVKRYSVFLELSDLLSTARLGMSANSKIITLSIPDALSIPANAIANLNGKNVVARLSDDGVVALEVVVGVVGDSLVEIKSGLSEKDLVVVGKIGDIPEVSASFGPPPGVRSNNGGQ